MATFDVHDQASWYFGPMSRIDATELLLNETELGVFLVRDSSSIIGDFVLCVRETSKVGHYIINKVENNHQTLLRIGNQVFEDLPELLDFYKSHYLDSTPLKRPANSKIDRPLNKLERVIAKFDFDGSDQDDLPFRRGEILTILSKDEEQWWTAKNSFGQSGQIPVPYVKTYENNPTERPSSVGVDVNLDNSKTPIANVSSTKISNMRTNTTHSLGGSLKKSDLNRKLPALARVKQTRIPNAYDKTALKLEVGDIINVTKTNINGQWEGELKGKRGHFPFTHVEFIENNDNCCINPSLQKIKISPTNNEDGNNKEQQNGLDNSEPISNKEWDE